MDYTLLTIEQLNSRLDSEGDNVELLLERAIYYYRSSQLSNAYNEFVNVLNIDKDNKRAQHYIELLKNSMNFEYRENYNV